MAYGLFGAKKKPMFGNPAEVYGAPPIMPEPIQHSPEMRQAAQPEAAPKKKGLFGKGGVGRAIAGTVGDFLMHRAGMGPVYAPAMLQQQQAAAEQAADLRERSLERADKAWEIDYRAQNKAPPAIAQNADYIRQTQGDEAADAYIKNYGRGPVQPQVVNIDGLGTFYGTPEEVAGAIQAARGGQSALPTFTNEDWEAAGSNSSGSF